MSEQEHPTPPESPSENVPPPEPQESGPQPVPLKFGRWLVVLGAIAVLVGYHIPAYNQLYIHDHLFGKSYGFTGIPSYPEIIDVARIEKWHAEHPQVTYEETQRTRGTGKECGAVSHARLFRLLADVRVLTDCWAENAIERVGIHAVCSLWLLWILCTLPVLVAFVFTETKFLPWPVLGFSGIMAFYLMLLTGAPCVMGYIEPDAANATVAGAWAAPVGAFILCFGVLACFTKKTWWKIMLLGLAFIIIPAMPAGYWMWKNW